MGKVIQMTDVASGYNKKHQRIRLEIKINENLWGEVNWNEIPRFNKLRVEYVLVTQIRSLFIAALREVLSTVDDNFDDCHNEVIAKVKESLSLQKKCILNNLPRHWNIHPNQALGMPNPAYGFVSRFLDAPDFFVNKLDIKVMRRLSFVARTVTEGTEAYVRIAEFFELFGEVHYLSKQRVHASSFKQRANGQLKRLDVMREQYQQYGEREARIAIGVYEKLLGAEDTSYLVRDAMAFMTKRVGMNTRRFDLNGEGFPYAELAHKLAAGVLLGQLHETEFGTLVFVKDSVLHELEEASIDIQSLAQLYVLTNHDLNKGDRVYIESPYMGLDDNQRLRLDEWLKQLDGHGVIVKTVD